MSDLLNALRIPEGDIVVTRKVPMTNETCDQLRAIKADREKYFGGLIEGPIMLPIPTIIMQLIAEEHQRIDYAKQLNAEI